VSISTIILANEPALGHPIGPARIKICQSSFRHVTSGVLCY